MKPYLVLICFINSGMSGDRKHHDHSAPSPSLCLHLTRMGLFGGRNNSVPFTFESQVDIRRQLKTLDKPLGLTQALRMQNITYARHYKIGISLISKDL